MKWSGDGGPYYQSGHFVGEGKRKEQKKHFRVRYMEVFMSSNIYGGEFECKELEIHSGLEVVFEWKIS